MMALGDWLTVKEAAELSGYNPEHIRRLIREGEIAARKFGPAWAIQRESLLAYLTKAQASEDRRHGPKKTDRPT